MRNDYYNEANDYQKAKIAELEAALNKGYRYYEVVNGEFVFYRDLPIGTDGTLIIEGLKKSWV